jgi:hypothetical protein
MAPPGAVSAVCGAAARTYPVPHEPGKSRSAGRRQVPARLAQAGGAPSRPALGPAERNPGSPSTTAAPWSGTEYRGAVRAQALRAPRRRSSRDHDQRADAPRQPKFFNRRWRAASLGFSRSDARRRRRRGRFPVWYAGSTKAPGRASRRARRCCATARLRSAPVGLWQKHAAAPRPG